MEEKDDFNFTPIKMLLAANMVLVHRSLSIENIDIQTYLLIIAIKLHCFENRIRMKMD